VATAGLKSRESTAQGLELANDILRSVREQQRQPFAITPALETWLAEAADKPA
jgi:hypothetical protein